MKKLIINADDFGLTEGVCQGIIEAGKRGGISSTSMMMCLPDKGAASEKWFHALTIPCGVHLQLTGEKEACEPLTKAMKTACETGFFPNKPDMVGFAPEDVLTEWRAQIELFIQKFGQPSHLDVHHGFQRRPEYQDLYFALAKTYDLPVRGDRELNEDFLQKASDKGITSAFITETWSGEFTPLSDLQRILEDTFQNSDVAEVVCHVGFCDETLMKTTSWNTVRQHEFDELTKPEFQTYLKENNIQLVGWDEV